jgi:hypothetical protein
MIRRWHILVLMCVTLCLAAVTGCALARSPDLGMQYYVNSSTGSDGNSGTSTATAWKSLPYALRMLKTGDTLNITAPATAPTRGTIATVSDGSASDPITIQGTAATDRAYFLGSVDISQDAPIGNIITNGNLEGWLSDGAPWGLTSATGMGSGAITKEITTTRDLASARLTRRGTTMFLRWDVENLPADTEYTFSYWHQETAESFRFQYTIQEDLAQDNYLQRDGSWSSKPYTFDPDDTSVGAWRQTTQTFQSNTAGNYFLTVSLAYDTTSYLDDISLVPTNNTHRWTEQRDGMYGFTGYVDTTQAFAKATRQAWDTSGARALQWVPRARSGTDIAPGEWWYEANALRYRLAQGETIDTLHFEAGTGNGVHAITQTNDYYVWKNFNEYMSNQYGINVTGNHTTFRHTGFFLNAVVGLYSTGKSNTAEDLEGAYTWSEDMFSIAGGDFTCTRCRAEYAFDDGFFAILSGRMTVINSIARFNGLQSKSDNSGFGVESPRATMHIYHSIAYRNYGRGIQIGDNNGYDVKNMIAWGSVGDDAAWVLDAATEAKGTHTHNIFESKNLAWTTDTTEQLAAAPQWTDPEADDFTLRSTSPAIDRGTDVGSASDRLGTPIPQGSTPDIGPYEYRRP